MHLFVLYLTKLCPSTLFLQKQSPARIIPRIIPDTYPESYPNLALLCHGPVGPFRKQPQSPAWCRREPFDIGYSLYVDSKEGGANHTPNHTSETYLRIIPPMQHALLTTEFSYTAIYTYICHVYVKISIIMTDKSIACSNTWVSHGIHRQASGQCSLRPRLGCGALWHPRSLGDRRRG